MTIPTLTKSVSDQVVNELGTIAMGMMTEISKSAGSSSVSIAVSGVVTGTIPDFERLYNIFSNTFSSSNEFASNFKQAWIVGKNKTSLSIVNAAQYVKNPKVYNNLICQKLSELICGYLSNNKKGADDQKDEITDIKIFALSLLLTALDIIDRQIKSVDSRGFTMRHLLLAIKNICLQFSSNEKLTASSDNSGFNMKNLLKDLNEEISHYVTDCYSDDAKTVLQDNAQALEEKLSVMTYESRNRVVGLIFNLQPIYSLFSNEKNTTLLKDTSSYLSFIQKVKIQGENSTDLTSIITDEASYQFVKNYIFNLGGKDVSYDEKTITTNLKTLKTITDKLPGDKNDPLKNEYIEELGAIISAVSECHLVLQEIEKIRKILHIMGESGAIWGNTPFSKTLERTEPLLKDLEKKETELNEKKESLKAKFEKIKKKAKSLQVKSRTTDGFWYKSYESLSAYITYLEESSTEATKYVQQMQKALDPRTAVTRFKAATAELEQAARENNSEMSKATLHLLHGLSGTLETKLTPSKVSVNNQSQSQDVKEIKTEIIPPVLEHKKEDPKIEEIQSDIQLEKDVVEVIEALKKQNLEADFIKKTLTQFSASSHPRKYFQLSQFYNPYITAPIQNPLKYFNREHTFNHTICAKWISGLRHYWTYKADKWSSPLHAEKHSIFYSKNFAIGVLIGYIELIDQIKTGEIYSESANALIQEFSKVVTTFQTLHVLNDTKRSDHNFSHLLDDCIAIKKKYETEKQLIDSQRAIHQNAKKIDSEIKLISHNYDSALLEILLGKPVGFILSNSNLVKDIKESESYENFKTKVRQRLGEKEREFIFKAIANEDELRLVKSSFLESKLENKEIEKIIEDRIGIIIPIPEREKKSNTNYSSLTESLIKSLSEFKQLKILIAKHQRLLSISAYWGNLTGVLYTGLKESIANIHACLESITKTMEVIHTAGNNLARSSASQDRWGKKFETLYRIREKMVDKISTVKTAMDEINESLQPSKIFGEFLSAVDLIRDLEAFKKDETGNSVEILELAEHFIAILKVQTPQEAVSSIPSVVTGPETKDSSTQSVQPSTPPSQGVRSLTTTSSPVISTKADGDCALHAIFGEWSESEKHLVCSNTKEKREKISHAITDKKDEYGVRTLIETGIRELIMSGMSESKGIGESIKNLGTKYQDFVRQQGKLSPQIWENFKTVLEHKENKNILEYIRAHGQATIPSGAQFSDSLYYQFYDALNKNDHALYFIINSKPALKKAFDEYNKLLNTTFDWSTNISENIKKEYAEFVSTPRTWLLPSELAIIAKVFDVNIIYYSSPNSKPETFSAKTGRNTVKVQFNGSNHYERLVSNQTPASTASSQGSVSKNSNSVSQNSLDSVSKKSNSVSQNSPDSVSKNSSSVSQSSPDSSSELLTNLSFSNMTEKQGKQRPENNLSRKGRTPDYAHQSGTESKNSLLSEDSQIDESKNAGDHFLIVSHSVVEKRLQEFKKRLDETKKFQAELKAHNKEDRIIQLERKYNELVINFQEINNKILEYKAQPILNTTLTAELKRLQELELRSIERQQFHLKWSGHLLASVLGVVFLPFTLVGYFRAKNAYKEAHDTREKGMENIKNQIHQRKQKLLVEANHYNDSTVELEKSITSFDKEIKPEIDKIKQRELEEDRRQLERIAADAMSHSMLALVSTPTKIQAQDERLNMVEEERKAEEKARALELAKGVELNADFCRNTRTITNGIYSTIYKFLEESYKNPKFDTSKFGEIKLLGFSFNDLQKGHTKEIIEMNLFTIKQYVTAYETSLARDLDLTKEEDRTYLLGEWKKAWGNLSEFKLALKNDKSSADTFDRVLAESSRGEKMQEALEKTFGAKGALKITHSKKNETMVEIGNREITGKIEGYSYASASIQTSAQPISLTK